MRRDPLGELRNSKVKKEVREECQPGKKGKIQDRGKWQEMMLHRRTEFQVQGTIKPHQLPEGGQAR